MSSVGIMASGVNISGGAPPALALVGTPSIFPAPNTAATTLTLDIPTPSGAAVGERLLVCATSSAQTASDFTIPSGWARIGLAPVNNAGVRILGWFISPVLVATPASTYQFTSPAAGRFGGIMWRLQGAHATQPHQTTFAYGAQSTNTVATVRFSTTDGNQPTENCLLLACCETQMTVGNATTPTSGPAGMTLATDAAFGLTSGTRSGLNIWYENRTPGAITAQTITFATAPATGVSNSVCVRAAVP